jgi:predicted Rossmann fold flavoprotein
VIQKFDALILGGGAAGLMCAIEAGKRGRRVAVLEHADKLGKKILISGGGRCNFTNIHCRPENFLSANPHFAKSALARYTPADFIALVEKHRIRYHEKTLGQLFCDGSAREIVTMLEEECRAANVTIILKSRVREVSRSDEFRVRTAKRLANRVRDLFLCYLVSRIARVTATWREYRVRWWPPVMASNFTRKC